jgi:hypothetical protein
MRQKLELSVKRQKLELSLTCDPGRAGVQLPSECRTLNMTIGRARSRT